MLKALSILHAGLIARREARPRDPKQPEFNIEDLPPPPPPRLVTTNGENLPPSASLTSELISSGREAYLAERQRRAEQTVEVIVADEPGQESAHARDVAGATTAAERFAFDVNEPQLLKLDAPLRARRRRAVTLRLRPEQHAQLLAIRRSLGCSFQVLIVRALTDFLERLEQSLSPGSDDGGTVIHLTRPDADAIAEAVATDAGKPPADVHVFALASGWCVAAWRQESGEAATPSDVLGAVIREQGVSDLISSDDAKSVVVAAENVSLDGSGHRLALTVRLEPDLHERLLWARDRLGRTGQDILLESIGSYLQD